MSLSATDLGFMHSRGTRIYKPKYADDADDHLSRSANSGTAVKKPRDKARTRTIFGRKKSISGRS